MSDTSFSMTINLHDIHGVKHFLPIVMQMDSDIDLSIDRYVVDGKSLLGIMGLSVDRNLTLTMHERVKGEFFKLREFMKDYGFLVE